MSSSATVYGAGAATICCALILLVLGSYVFYHSMGEDCFSKWWPRSYAIVWFFMGLCSLGAAIASMVMQSKVTVTTK